MNLRVTLWTLLTNAYPTFLRKIYKMDLGKGVRIAQSTFRQKRQSYRCTYWR